MHCFTSEPRPLPGDAFYLGFAGSLGGSVLRFRVTTTEPGRHRDPPPDPSARRRGVVRRGVGHGAQVLRHDRRAEPGRRGRPAVPSCPRGLGSRRHSRLLVQGGDDPDSAGCSHLPGVAGNTDGNRGRSGRDHRRRSTPSGTGPKAWAGQTAWPGSLSCSATRRYWPAGTAKTCRLRPGTSSKTG